jgi:hypothetical protein
MLFRIIWSKLIAMTSHDIEIVFELRRRKLLAAAGIGELP